MIWIKASEMLPKVNGSYFIRHKDGRRKAVWFTVDKGQSLLKLYPYDYEWLCEDDYTPNEIWDAACKKLLSDISKTFLNPSNQDKADKTSDQEVFQAIGEWIINFPKPEIAVPIKDV